MICARRIFARSARSPEAGDGAADRVGGEVKAHSRTGDPIKGVAAGVSEVAPNLTPKNASVRCAVEDRGSEVGDGGPGVSDSGSGVGDDVADSTRPKGNGPLNFSNQSGVDFGDCERRAKGLTSCQPQYPDPPMSTHSYTEPLKTALSIDAGS